MMLAPDEVEDFWALGVPIEAIFVPDDELARAATEGRVQRAIMFSSMGTAETYWYRLESFPGDVWSRRESVVVPPGERAYDTPHDEYADDRDVEKVLWQPWRNEQILRLAAGIPEDKLAVALGEAARMLAALERRWASGDKLEKRAALVAALEAIEPPAEIEHLVAAQTNQSVRHLRHGVRARWVTRDAGALVHAVEASLDRFDDKVLSKRDLRFALVRVLVRIAWGRSWAAVDVA